jgi:microcystin-dependent protein
MSEPFLGTIMPVGFQFAPSGWMTCQGQSLPISQYNAVFALLGTTFGGNGQTTFGLPNLQGRTHLGWYRLPSRCGRRRYQRHAHP